MADLAKKNHLKGIKTEELLANYFRKMGYYVIRGVEYNHKGLSITDIDLWMYMKSSSISREISIVDIKDRKSPQAFERILWTKGLQQSIGADKAIVATKDNKDEVISFGKINDVIVLNGTFINKLDKMVTIADRYTEEDLYKEIKDSTFGKVDGDWKKRLLECQSALCGGISFDSINYLIDQAEYFANQSIIRPQLQSLSLRIFYRILSMLCISLDYHTRGLVFIEKQNRFMTIKNGFTYGEGGIEHINKSINQGLQLIEEYGNVKDFNSSVTKINIRQAFMDINSEVLSEYFSNVNILQDLFMYAHELESMSMSIIDPKPYDGCREVKSLIGCFLDFWRIDRSKFGLVKLE